MNAKTEFLQHVEDPATVLCAIITHGDPFFDENQMNRLNLPVNHTAEDMHNFIKSLDFKYNNGYGGQELYGCIWFKNGTWSTRGEYDGSEWWDHHSIPEIPKELKSKQ